MASEFSDDLANAKHAEAVERAVRRLVNEPIDKKVEVPRLPNEKAQFPRMLCLDMNQWVYLARAHYGRKPTADAIAALAAIRQYVRSGRLVAPIASANFIEAGESSSPERRERLARFMVELSGNLSIVNHDVIALGECKVALMERYRLEACHPIRSQLVHFGLAAIFGNRFRMRNEALRELFDAVQDSPEVSAFLLGYGSGDATARREKDEKALQVFKDIRESDSKMTISARRELEIRNAFEGGHIAHLLYQAADDLGIARDALRSWLDDAGNRENLHDSIPSCNVALRLIVSRARNREHVNDTKDLGFLKVVVPYANYVVTEKSWAHLLTTAALDKKYGTSVFGNLKDLVNQLQQDLGSADGAA
jgi:hypothetical protein